MFYINVLLKEKDLKKELERIVLENKVNKLEEYLPHLKEIKLEKDKKKKNKKKE